MKSSLSDLEYLCRKHFDMLFNTWHFAVFLPIVFILYWLLSNKALRYQNILLLVASYYFYACWDWRFLFLLIFSTLLDFYTGLKMERSVTTRHKKTWFWLSVLVNLGFLAVFKYYNFFISSFTEFLSPLGMKVHPSTISIILPVGISFYTFHGLSYVVDIYKGRIKGEKDFIDYSVFVSFFPLLVAGPIERATHLLPQIKQKRVFNYDKALDGLRQILWGLFKKVVIADNCASIANMVFNDSSHYTGVALLLGALFFTIQIYGDFSGYSDIALGVARLFGIELLQNFSYPYFSRDIAEFWRRWHISLSSWFRDYLYIPLGGSNGSNWMRIRNTFIIFTVSGLWHGANWTFVIWGMLNALFIMPSIIYKTNRKNMDIVAQGKLLPSVKEAISMLITFCLTVFAWIFFRSENVAQAFSYISRMLNFWDGTGLSQSRTILSTAGLLFLSLIALFFTIEWLGREQRYAIATMGRGRKRIIRYSFYFLITISLFLFGGKDQQFIYFQF